MLKLGSSTRFPPTGRSYHTIVPGPVAEAVIFSSSPSQIIISPSLFGAAGASRIVSVNAVLDRLLHPVSSLTDSA